MKSSRPSLLPSRAIVTSHSRISTPSQQFATHSYRLKALPTQDMTQLHSPESTMYPSAENEVQVVDNKIMDIRRKSWLLRSLDGLFSLLRSLWQRLFTSPSNVDIAETNAAQIEARRTDIVIISDDEREADIFTPLNVTDAILLDTTTPSSVSENEELLSHEEPFHTEQIFENKETDENEQKEENTEENNGMEESRVLERAQRERDIAEAERKRELERQRDVLARKYAEDRLREIDLLVRAEQARRVLTSEACSPIAHNETEMQRENNTAVLSLSEFKGNLSNKAVLVYCDLGSTDGHNVALSPSLLSAVNLLQDSHAKVLLLSSFGNAEGHGYDRNNSLAPLVTSLFHALNDTSVRFVDDCISLPVAAAVHQMREKEVALLENVQFHPQATKEERKALCDSLVQHADVVVLARTDGLSKAMLERAREKNTTILGKSSEPFAAVDGRISFPSK